jgi:hypothetical protein
MFNSHPGLSPALLVTGILAGFASAGCSKDADSSPKLDIASSAGRASLAGDTVARTADTSLSIGLADTSPVAPKPSPAKPKPSPAKPRPKPSPAAVGPTDSAPAPAGGAPVARDNPDEWLSYDAASNTVKFELIAGPFTFNGYRNGEATLIVPSSANVEMNFVNKDGTPHSAIIISGDGPIPNSATEPAIPRAYTNKALEGLPQEASDVMRFKVPESGTYRIFCGVPGHGLSGMWLWMKVDPAAKAPSFGPTK